MSDPRPKTNLRQIDAVKNLVALLRLLDYLERENAELREKLAALSLSSSTFTVDEIRAYFSGWKLAANADCDMPSYAVLSNALLMLEDDQDGIASPRGRRNDQGQRAPKKDL